MIVKFVTKRDNNGNRYTLEVNHTEKTYKKDYNIMFYDGFIEITKSAMRGLEGLYKKQGYTEIF